MWNAWTDAQNYLLVEKLVAKSEEESWKEVAEMVDGSGTYATESYKCRAIRKFAATYGLAVEAVSLQDVIDSPQGLNGWAEMCVTVPGVAGEGPATPSSGSPPLQMPSPAAGSAVTTPPGGVDGAVGGKGGKTRKSRGRHPYFTKAKETSQEGANGSAKRGSRRQSDLDTPRYEPASHGQGGG